MGFGTIWRGPEEQWAAERGLLYGHLHIHLLLPTQGGLDPPDPGGITCPGSYDEYAKDPAAWIYNGAA